MTMDRSELLRAATALTGIDFVRVAPSQTEITLFLQHDDLPAGLAATLAALPATAFEIVGEGQVAPHRVAVVNHVSPLPPKVDGRAVLRIHTAAPGGFGFYRLTIDSSAIDPFFNGVRFSFKAACDSALDCREEPPPCPDGEIVDFPIDYRARDFWSYRRALIDFAAQRYPDWQDRLEADIGMTVLELIAALGDEFAYANDRIARESRLDSASQRRSLRQLARLVDYRIDDGAGATVWIDVEASAPVKVDAGVPVSDATGRVVFEIGKGLRDRSLGIPPLPTPPPQSYAVDPSRNSLLPYIWDENATCLARDSTSLELDGAHALALQPDPAIDPKGRWVVLRTRPASPAIEERRLAVRIVSATDDIDPLPPAKPPITRIRFEPPLPLDLDLETLEVRGNLLPATCGETHELRFRVGEAQSAADPDAGLPQAVERVGPNSALCYPRPGTPEDEADRVKMLFSLDWSDTVPLVWLTDNNGLPVPEIELVREGDRAWHWRPSLVGEVTAEPTDRAFTLDDGVFRRVVGFDRAGQTVNLVDYATGDGSTIRFGDGEFGMIPPAGSLFSLRYRLGNGSRMNVARDTLTRLVAAVPGVTRVNNPLPATGGRDPEPAAAIRKNAPQDFRVRTFRAVRTDDYAAFAEQVPQVQKAGAVSRWTGSWPTIFVTPDPLDTTVVTAELHAAIGTSLDVVRQAGRETKVGDPRYADLDLEIELCVGDNAYRGEVKKAALGALFGPHGDGGFFDPDNFTFGTPLSRADLVAALQAVQGVRAVEDMRVRRRGYFDWRPFQEFALRVGPAELVRVSNDRELPERGAVRLIMAGGA